MIGQFHPLFDEPSSPLSVLHPLPPQPSSSSSSSPSVRMQGELGQLPLPNKWPPSSSPHQCYLQHMNSTTQTFSLPCPRQTPPHAYHHAISLRYNRPRGLRIITCLRPWFPLLLYAITSLAFLFAIAFWRDEVFAHLDRLSHWLRIDDHYGHVVLFSLIFLTTIPPFPLYSTLIILSGYTFGPLTGAIISYFAALTGALIVFIVSRAFLREQIARWLASAATIRRVVRAIEKRPKLLFLIRLAPYPYNVMNCLLAASPTLTLRTYALCTALSLFKVIIHTALGASMHSFRDWHASSPEQPESGAQSIARLWAVLGVVLCVLIFVYLTIVASRAVDQELEDEEGGAGEERVAFLPVPDAESQVDEDGLHATYMVEASVRAHHLVPFRIEVVPPHGA